MVELSEDMMRKSEPDGPRTALNKSRKDSGVAIMEFTDSSDEAPCGYD